MIVCKLILLSLISFDLVAFNGLNDLIRLSLDPFLIVRVRAQCPTCLCLERSERNGKSYEKQLYNVDWNDDSMYNHSHIKLSETL